MISNKVIGVVIPCFKGGDATAIVINEVLDYADYRQFLCFDMGQ